MLLNDVFVITLLLVLVISVQSQFVLFVIAGADLMLRSFYPWLPA